MTSIAQFNPVLSQHAIERCAASVTFKPNIPEKAFLRLGKLTAEELAKQGFIAEESQNFGIEILPDGGFRQLEPTIGGPRLFSSPSLSTTLTFSPDSISWASSSYVRWQPFIGSFEQHVRPLLSKILDTVEISGVRLEYWDRFFWTGTWSDFTIGDLLRTDNEYVAGQISKRPREWHSHVGWFSSHQQFRRLTNVNIDVQELTTNVAIAPRPSVAIYSSLTDHINIPSYGSTKSEDLTEIFAVHRLEEQHLALKDIFGHIITEEMANRIGLFSRRSPNARP